MVGVESLEVPSASSGQALRLRSSSATNFAQDDELVGGRLSKAAVAPKMHRREPGESASSAEIREHRARYE
jgi:hypothetical protein